MRDLKVIVEGLATAKAWGRPSWDGKPSREIKGEVALGPSTDGKGTVMLELSVSHSKDSKEYRASVHVVTVEESDLDGTKFQSRSYALLDKNLGGTLDRVASPRYSAKALDAFWELQIGKLQDDPSILARLDLDHNQEENEYFEASKLIDALKAEGVESWCWQSGGGTATLMLPGENPMLVGPGSYHWEDPGKSLFTTDDLSFALDHDDYYEKRGLDAPEPENHNVEPGTSIADVAKAVAVEYRKHNNKEQGK